MIIPTGKNKPSGWNTTLIPSCALGRIRVDACVLGGMAGNRDDYPLVLPGLALTGFSRQNKAYVGAVVSYRLSGLLSVSPVFFFGGHKIVGWDEKPEPDIRQSFILVKEGEPFRYMITRSHYGYFRVDVERRDASGRWASKNATVEMPNLGLFCRLSAGWYDTDSGPGEAIETKTSIQFSPRLPWH